MKTAQPLSSGDRELIAHLRDGDSMTVGKLVKASGVTATAVRQRLVRLMALGMIDRTEDREGRGRPSHVYHLTEKGRNTSANNLDDLALVLWQEVQQIPDRELRKRVIAGAVERLAQRYESAIRGSASDLGDTTEQRMRKIAEIFAAMDLPVSYEEKDGLPVIKVSGCPFPGLGGESREICEMEQELIQKLVGSEVGLCKCQKDGDRCCSFEVAK
ncbi:MAG: hypothetical protein AAF456_14420 [Planctomycetota bacterium]